METAIFIFDVILTTLCANSFFALREFPILIFFVLPVVILTNLMPMYTKEKADERRLYVCSHGVKCLGVFVISATGSVVFHLCVGFYMLPEKWVLFLLSVILCIIVEAVIFWNGIISVYISSVQLGIRLRVLGILLGYVPIANIICLFRIIRTVRREIEFETGKDRVNQLRKDERVCETRYPILFVHGVFFRDMKFLNYWGRVPYELKENGATVFYGEHQSALSVKESGRELSARIKAIVDETGCGKVNIIAHSKGGLDSRYAVSCCGVGDLVSSLTTINTPHKGCNFADYLLNKIPGRVKLKIAKAYNDAMLKLGDKSPDFLSAVNDLLPDSCEAFNRELIIPSGIFTQSVGSRMKKASAGKFPLWFTYHIAKRFDGENDGLVGVDSFEFGEKYTFLEPCGKRGISHGDMVDMNRENIEGFDVREFYVELVSDLKKRGY